MARASFVIADTHFGHKGICSFKNYDGTKTRPFDTPEEMDEVLVANWNSVVQPSDRVYVLGDVAINRRCLETVGRCNGSKVLIKGNHDIFKLKDYVPYFDDIRAYKVGDGGSYIMSHIPVHPDCLARFGLNIHGHLHANTIKIESIMNIQEDRRYRCVSVEQINYTPIRLEKILG